MNNIEKMDKKNIIKAYSTIRKSVDCNSIPDDVLDYLKDAAIEKIEGVKTIPDIRNKMSPLLNLVTMVRNGVDKKTTKSQIESCITAIEYLCDTSIAVKQKECDTVEISLQEMINLSANTKMIHCITIDRETNKKSFQNITKSQLLKDTRKIKKLDAISIQIADKNSIKGGYGVVIERKRELIFISTDFAKMQKYL